MIDFTIAKCCPFAMYQVCDKTFSRKYLFTSTGTTHFIDVNFFTRRNKCQVVSTRFTPSWVDHNWGQQTSLQCLPSLTHWWSQTNALLPASNCSVSASHCIRFLIVTKQKPCVINLRQGIVRIAECISQENAWKWAYLLYVVRNW